MSPHNIKTRQLISEGKRRPRRWCVCARVPLCVGSGTEIRHQRPSGVNGVRGWVGGGGGRKETAQTKRHGRRIKGVPGEKTDAPMCAWSGARSRFGGSTSSAILCPCPGDEGRADPPPSSSSPPPPGQAGTLVGTPLRDKCSEMLTTTTTTTPPQRNEQDHSNTFFVVF